MVRGAIPPVSDATRDDLVFPNAAGDKPKRFTQILRRNLKAAGLLYDEHGYPRSAYSFRHYYATLKVNNAKTPVKDLGENMGCSMKVLDRYYTSHQRALERLEQRSA